MAVYTPVFVLCFVSLSVVLASDANSQIHQLKTQISTVKNYTKQINKANKDLTTALDIYTDECERNITHEKISKYVIEGISNYTEQLLDELYQNLTNVQVEENRLAKENNSSNLDDLKLELAIKLIKNNLQLLQKQTDEGDSEKCFGYQLSDRVQGTSRKANKVDEVRILEHLLEVAKTEMAHAVAANSVLKTKIDNKMQYCKKEIKSIQDSKKHIEADIKEADEIIKAINNEIASHRKHIEIIKEEISKSGGDFQQKKNEYAKLRSKLDSFGKDIDCFKKLEKEVQHQSI